MGEMQEGREMAAFSVDSLLNDVRGRCCDCRRFCNHWRAGEMKDFFDLLKRMKKNEQ
jgi:hypothetical protein